MYVIVQAYYDFFRRKITEQIETHTVIISILQIITLFYALFALNYLTKSFLIRKHYQLLMIDTYLFTAVLKEIIQRYKISSTISPFLNSMVSMMPEFFINLLSILNGGTQMASFGLIVITGSSVLSNIKLFISLIVRFHHLYWHYSDTFKSLCETRCSCKFEFTHKEPLCLHGCYAIPHNSFLEQSYYTIRTFCSAFDSISIYTLHQQRSTNNF